MKYKWINSNNSGELIVFFNGWGMDESVVKHLNYNNYDVLMIYDYNNLDTDFDFSKLNKYSKKHLVAWSMGVMIATKFNISYDSATAINGTLAPIDNNYGIPTRIYDLTIKNYNEFGAKKFIKNMFNEDIELPKCNRKFENQKTELSAIKAYKANENFKYNRVIISNNDKIIPTKNQCNYWEIDANIESGHCPFFNFKTWEELL